MWPEKKVERPFRAFATEVESVAANRFSTCRVDIYEGHRLIGGYDRNYSAFGEETFEPFELDGKWYALYSKDYTATRVMRLPDCQDIGGEEPDAGGFCPTEFYVPRFRRVVFHWPGKGRSAEYAHFESAAEEPQQTDEERAYCYQEYGEWQSSKIGFVSGCLWGDDSSWKLQVIDLARAAEGKLAREERFGYLELSRMPLVEAVRFHSSGPDWKLSATIQRQQTWDVGSGKTID
jgi:hypothetical protein